jgi:cytidine deaminase
MKRQQLTFDYEVYNGIEELDESDAQVLSKARSATSDAYAPYSHFRVGAAARLRNGQIVTGTNQENASYPAGICAERTLLSVAASLFPSMPIDTLAISYDNGDGPSDHPICPCGICRQSLQEFEQRTRQPVRLLLGGQEGKVFAISRASLLLPLAFTADELD